MKKTFTAICMAIAGMMALTSCEGTDITEILGGDDALGNITLTTSNPTGNQIYAGDSTITFKSAIGNVNIRQLDIDIDTMGADFDTTMLNINAGTIFVGVNGANITANTANINWPVCGINLRDTNTGTYLVSVPVDNFDFLEYIDTTSINSMITTGLNFQGRPSPHFALTVHRDEYSIGYFGRIPVTSFPGAGEMVEGTINNVRAFYITLDQVRAILDMDPADRPANLVAALPSITFNGTFSSLRANMTSVINRVNELEEVEISK